MNPNSIILYALASAEKQYRPISYYCIFEGNFSIAEMMYRASLLKSRNPEIAHIFAIDNLLRDNNSFLCRNSCLF